MISIGAGQFEGNLVIDKPLRLVGAGPATVLRAASGTALTVSSRDVVLDQFAVEGPIALRVMNRAAVLASKMKLDGVTGVLVVEEGAQLVLSDAALAAKPTGANPCAAAVSVNAGAFDASRTTIRGGCRRSIDVATSRISMTKVSMKDALVTGLQLADSEAVLNQVDASTVGPDQAVAFSARSFVTGKSVTLRGGLQGWFQRSGKSELAEVSVEGTQGAGIALVGGSGRFSSVRMTGPFAQASVFLTDNARIDISELTVKRTGSAGVLAMRSDVALKKASFSGIRFDRDGDFGHALVAERARITASDLSVRDTNGAAAYASQAPSSIDVEKLDIQGVGAALVSVDGARVSAKGLTGEATGVAFFAGTNATVEVARADIRGTTGTIECDGAKVRSGSDVKLITKTARVSCSVGEIDEIWHTLVVPRP